MRTQLLWGEQIDTELVSQDSSLVDTFLQRTDKIEPTLVLSPVSMTIGSGVFGRTPYAISHFNSVVNKFLRLDKEQNEILTKNLRDEDIFHKFEKDRRFQAHFDFKKNISMCLHDLWVIQRPIFMAVSDLHDFYMKIRAAGNGAGIQYDGPGPQQSVFGPATVTDIFQGETAGVLKSYQMIDVLHGVYGAVSIYDHKIITNNVQQNQIFIDNLLKEESV